MFVNLKERAERFDHLVQNSDVINNYDVVKEIKIDQKSKDVISTSVNYFLLTCLNSFFKDKFFKFSDDVVTDYADYVLKLPNITPNGLVLPKQENIFAYNMVQKSVAEAFINLGLEKHVDRIQFPLNIRLQSGKRSLTSESRPRSSMKKHTDLWAGDPASGVMVFLPVLGDVECSGIDFFAIDKFPQEFVKTLHDYNEGQEVIKDARKVCSINNKSWFLADAYAIHQTTKNKEGIRVSVDFRIITKEKLNSDLSKNPLREAYFIPTEKWLEIGKSKMLYTAEPLEEFKADPNVLYTNEYAVKIDLLDLSSLQLKN